MFIKNRCTSGICEMLVDSGRYWDHLNHFESIAEHYMCLCNLNRLTQVFM